MAASTVTLDTGEFVYIDRTGIGHTVTNAQTFTLTVTDGGVSAVEYSIPVAQSVTTTDGYTIDIRPNANQNNAHRSIHFLTDAGQGSNFQDPPINGEFVMTLQNGNPVEQIWKIAKINPSDADYGSAGTITMTLEDQFGNRMVLPATGAGITVGQAS